jgi:hypothetical protein
MRTVLIALTAIFLELAAILVFYYWPRKLFLPRPRVLEIVEPSNFYPVIRMPDRFLIGQLAQFDDNLFAFLMFDYYRSQKILESKRVMLISRLDQGELLHQILVQLPDDLIAGIVELAELERSHLTSSIRYQWINRANFSRDLDQTDLIEPAASLRSLDPEVRKVLRKCRDTGQTGKPVCSLTHRKAIQEAARLQSMQSVTTYAGLLLRDLLNRFHGGELHAIGAHNGTANRPNLRYAAGVELVANYARRVIAGAAEFDGIERPEP